MTSYRGFSHTTQQYYFNNDTLSRNVLDEIIVGLYVEDGGCQFEFLIRWYDMPDGMFFPKIEVFHDAWEAFIEFDDLFTELTEQARDNTKLPPEDVIETLRACDFVNCTQYDDQYDDPTIVDNTERTPYTKRELGVAIRKFVATPIDENEMHNHMPRWMNYAMQQAFARGVPYDDHHVKVLRQAYNDLGHKGMFCYSDSK